jgi:Spy/CpxP family protein refolding chaperone
MHPGFHQWWKHRAQACGHDRAEAAHPEGGHGYQAAGWQHEGGGLGVRRPLRFLAHRLELRDDQVAELARILNGLKTERAQAEVDQQRSLTAFAEAVEQDAFDEAGARKAGDLRVDSAQRVRDAVLRALGELHRLLSPEQRKQLAYLLRTGALSM